MSDLYTDGFTGILPSNLKPDYTINGFSIKETIKEVLMQLDDITLDKLHVDHIAEEIKEAFAVKLRMKQG
jgi:hypothetical protein